MAFDSTTLTTLGESNVEYTGKYQLAFSYSYTTNNIDILSATENFSFYLINSNEYFCLNSSS